MCVQSNLRCERNLWRSGIPKGLERGINSRRVLPGDGACPGLLCSLPLRHRMQRSRHGLLPNDRNGLGPHQVGVFQHPLFEGQGDFVSRLPLETPWVIAWHVGSISLLTKFPCSCKYCIMLVESMLIWPLDNTSLIFYRREELQICGKCRVCMRMCRCCSLCVYIYVYTYAPSFLVMRRHTGARKSIVYLFTAYAGLDNSFRIP